jgi:hypothetical protein
VGYFKRNRKTGLVGKLGTQVERVTLEGRLRETTQNKKK